MKRILALLMVGLIGYTLFLLLYLPMPLALQWFVKPPPELGLYWVRGNLMRGQADALIFDSWRLDQIRWNFSPAQLLGGHLAYQLRFTNPDGRGQAIVGRGLFGDTQLQDLDLMLEVAYLSRRWSLSSRFGGQLRLLLQGATVEDGRITAAQGSLSWTGAHLRGDPPVPLGDFQAVIEPGDKEGDGFSGPISSQGGPLSVSGSLQLTPDGRWSLRGKLASRDRANTALARMLDSLGKAGADGKVAFKLSGTLSPLINQTQATDAELAAAAASGK